jgi:hypothetical protein
MQYSVVIKELFTSSYNTNTTAGVERLSFGSKAILDETLQTEEDLKCAVGP